MGQTQSHASETQKPRLSHAVRILIFAFCVASFVFFLFFASKIGECFASCRRRTAARRTSLASTMTDSVEAPIVHVIGVDQAADLPPGRVEPLTFVYSSDELNEKAECAVCMAEFIAGETGRILPLCLHKFHGDCIDLWLASNSTCPLCRSPAIAVLSTPPPPPI